MTTAEADAGSHTSNQTEEDDDDDDLELQDAEEREQNDQEEEEEEEDDDDNEIVEQQQREEEAQVQDASRLVDLKSLLKADGAMNAVTTSRERPVSVAPSGRPPLASLSVA
ncbi:hypothetical protein PINS_up024010 [Pythium insidiosum]|nr:hypothetical protein PINS_up024010 [Pythium insidiosum]